MRVLVTGGAGFIGSHIVDALQAAGHEPAVVDDLSSGRRENLPANVPLYEVDVRDEAKLAPVFEDFRPQWVCHQAAQMSVSRSVREPAFDAEINILGLLRVLEQSAATGVQRVVFASSGGVLYGNVAEPADEQTPSNPISPYGISKWAGEKYLEFFSREHNIETVALRYSNVYGPRQSPHGEAGVVAIFATLMLAAQQATINGDGSIVRDFVYVGDVARANLAALQSNLPDAFVPMNVGTGAATTINELAQNMHTLCGQSRQRTGNSEPVPALKYGPPRAGDLQSNLIDCGRARSLIGWEPGTAIDSGLESTVDWFSGQPG